MGITLLKNEIEVQLAQLVGLPLVMTWRAADMRIFHFGMVRPHKKTNVGEYALHIQCAWRLDSSRGIITGRSDLFHKPTGGYFSEEWDYSGDTLQDSLLRGVLDSEDAETDILLDADKQLSVERVHASNFVDVEIFFTKGYRLIILPTGSKGEAWRLFRPGIDERHSVFEEGSASFQ